MARDPAQEWQQFQQNNNNIGNKGNNGSNVNNGINFHAITPAQQHPCKYAGVMIVWVTAQGHRRNDGNKRLCNDGKESHTMIAITPVQWQH